MRVQLIHPPSNYDETDSYLEPLGLAYVAAACRGAGHEVRVHDMVSLRFADVEGLLAEVERFRPEVVGFSTMTENHRNGLVLARALRERLGATTVFGGWHVSGVPESAEDPAVDFVVRGEGEEAIVELLAHLDPTRTGLPLEEIRGIAYARPGGGHERTPERPRIRDLDALPRPVRDGLARDRYRYAPLFDVPLSRMRTVSVQASRGCPYTCGFCQTPPLLGRAYVRRDPRAIVDEIEMLVEREGANTLFFRDEEFTLRPDWVLEICAELVRRGAAPATSLGRVLPGGRLHPRARGGDEGGGLRPRHRGARGDGSHVEPANRQGLQAG